MQVMSFTLQTHTVLSKMQMTKYIKYDYQQTQI